MAPDLDLMQDALTHLAPDGMLALFAGVPPGNCLDVPVDLIARHGLQVTGTSGSSLADQQAIIAKTTSGELAPDRIVAAVGGLRTIVAHGGTGFLVNGRDPAVFAHYTEALLDDPALRAQLAAAAAVFMLQLAHTHRGARRLAQQALQLLIVLSLLLGTLAPAMLVQASGAPDARPVQQAESGSPGVLAPVGPPWTSAGLPSTRARSSWSSSAPRTSGRGASAAPTPGAGPRRSGTTT